MSLKSTKLKITIMSVIVLIVAIACIGICSIQKANAGDSESQNPANASVILSTNLEQYSPKLTVQYTEDWYPSYGTPTYTEGSWQEGLDVIKQFDPDGKARKLQYRCGYDFTSTLYITLVDNSVSWDIKNKSLIFHVAGDDSELDTNAFAWIINEKEVSISEVAVDLGKTQSLSFNCDTVSDFEIWGTVYEQDGTTPIEGATIQFYTSDDKLVEGAQDTSDEDGDYWIKGIKTLNLPGYFLVTCPNYENAKYKVEFSKDFERKIEHDFILFPGGAEAEAYITGGEHHIHFEIVMTEYEGDVPYTETEIMEVIEDVQLPVGINYSINDEGNMVITVDDNADERDNVVIKPVGEDGYVVDSWNVNGSVLEANKTYTVGEDDIDGFVTYKLANANPQTGDSLPLAVVAISIIALLAGRLMLRKSFK